MGLAPGCSHGGGKTAQLAALTRPLWSSQLVRSARMHSYIEYCKIEFSDIFRASSPHFLFRKSSQSPHPSSHSFISHRFPRSLHKVPGMRRSRDPSLRFQSLGSTSQCCGRIAVQYTLSVIEDTLLFSTTQLRVLSTPQPCKHDRRAYSAQHNLALEEIKESGRRPRA